MCSHLVKTKLGDYFAAKFGHGMFLGLGFDFCLIYIGFFRVMNERLGFWEHQRDQALSNLVLKERSAD